jgi:hypothetical protein
MLLCSPFPRNIERFVWFGPFVEAEDGMRRRIVKHWESEMMCAPAKSDFEIFLSNSQEEYFEITFCG